MKVAVYSDKAFFLMKLLFFFAFFGPLFFLTFSMFLSYPHSPIIINLLYSGFIPG